ncbi:unnamed protein product [Periconia digitata]|uniref:Aminoglycoside phosphotransferase domain-containing protein n=1 Tax=Periconia digitata TaxID=1303443 RepID=A0A9W4XSE3_9PLEO|nr:unnamed protein product [Periconia digitata]
MRLPSVDIFTCREPACLYSTVASNIPLPTSPSTSRVAAPSTLTAMQQLVQDALNTSNLGAQATERVEGQFHHIQLAKLADGDALMIKYPSNHNIRLLRHERQTLEAEYRTTSILREFTQLPVPEIVDYDGHGSVFGSPYLLTARTPGQRLSEALPYTSITEKNSIDRMLGSVVCTLASLTSPRFGPIHEVSGGNGSDSWRETFLGMLEAALQDAEDMLITLPYEFLRQRVGQHRSSLDHITVPRLVAFDICDPENVLVDEDTKQITCLMGLSNSIWGDPLMSDVVANGSDDFCRRYEDSFPCEEDAQVRRSIYAVYRAVVQIVAHHYRPYSGIDELEARRSMTHALNELAHE